MGKPRYFVFEPFRLDAFDERLWENERRIRLGRKAFAALQLLVSRPGQLVTKEDLLATVWSGTTVCEAVLTTAMRELRRALGDPARTPRFIETVHGRGYRFIAPIARAAENGSLADFGSQCITGSRRLVGRDAERAQLRDWWAIARQGERRIGFVAGEAGVGKTALVEAFVAEAHAQGSARIARGQCVQQYGVGEAYLPILEGLGRLAREEDPLLQGILREYAPSWLPHLPSLTPGGEFNPSGRVTSEKMLRELADALELLTARDSLIFVLEDLHWCDAATLEWLGYIARRRDPARLLILGTYRPAEIQLHEHPLRTLITELRPHPQRPEIALDYLSAESVRDYLLDRCGPISRLPFPRLEDLAQALHRRTGGHPLFLAAIVEELVREGILESAVASGITTAGVNAIASLIPSSVRQFIERRFEQMSCEEQAILEAASVAGDSFSVAAAATGASLPEEKVEERCAAWARDGLFLIGKGMTSWPDGTLAACFGFRHDLFREVVYERISPERRARLHLKIGDRLEIAYRKRAAAIAAELAMHFDRGRELRKAASYLTQAARNALQRSAYAEASRHLGRGHQILAAIPEGRMRLRLELDLSLLLGQTLMTTKGWGVEAVDCIYQRARELCEELGDAPRLLQTIWGLMAQSVVRAEYRKTQSLAQEMNVLAEKQDDPNFQVLAHMELGGAAFALGDASSSRHHFQQADLLYNPCQRPAHIAQFGADLGLFSRVWATHAQWHWGYPDLARATAEKTLGQARESSHPFTETIVMAYAAMLNQFRRNVEEVDRMAKITIEYATEHGFSYYLAWAEALAGWSNAVQGDCGNGVARIRRSIRSLQTMAGMRMPYYHALLAEACGCCGQIDEAFAALDEAFAGVRKTDERWCEAELHRLRGDLLCSAAVNRRHEAEACYRTAIDIARCQQAKSLELRAAISLGRLWRDGGKPLQAHQFLSEVYHWFPEGFESHDMKIAKSLMDELAS